MVVILDNIRSLHNVGAIFRTADAVGAEKIYLCGITPSPVDRFGEVRGKLKKTALGAEATVPWNKAANALSVIKSLKKEGYAIVALEQAPKSIPYFTFKDVKKEKIAIVLGAEVTGISPAILAKCDTVIEIPMKGSKESLNVGIAFGVVAFHLIYG